MPIDGFKATAFKIQSDRTFPGKGPNAMIFRWLKRRRELSARVSVEADAMIALFGDSAYYIARSRASAEQQRQPNDGYWGRVRTEIALRTRGDYVDTATRYLQR
jgi:hypothetical protein